MGQAVASAARDARRQLIAAAAAVLAAEEQEITFEQGSIRFCETGFSVQEILRRYFGDTRGEIVGRGFFKVSRNDAAPLGYPTLAWEVGIAGAEVNVDRMTGEVRIAKYVSLGDAGKMINPLQCRGQEEGAVMFGIGHTLFEEILYEDGKLLNPNLVDYRIPRFRDVPPDFTSIILEEGGGPGPQGAKGLGEGGALAVSAAVCNAVYDAIGVRIFQVPLGGERVWLAARNQDATAGDQDRPESPTVHA
jgi:CO/xanthine dehydrogenase Mo-binding subunit